MTEQPIEMLHRVLSGDEQAWRDLLRRYRALIYRCILKVAGRGSAPLCEDDLDEIYAELCMNLLRDGMKKLRAFDPSRGVKLSTWIGMLAANTAYDHLRRRSRFPRLADEASGSPDPASGAPDPLERLLALERRQVLYALVHHLSQRDRRFVSLYYEQGLRPEQVAAEMGISVKTVYTKKHKIRAKLVALAEQHSSRAA